MRTLDHDPEFRDRVARHYQMRLTFEEQGYVFPGIPRPENRLRGWLHRAAERARERERAARMSRTARAG